MLLYGERGKGSLFKTFLQPKPPPPSPLFCGEGRFFTAFVSHSGNITFYGNLHRRVINVSTHLPPVTLYPKNCFIDLWLIREEDWRDYFTVKYAVYMYSVGISGNTPATAISRPSKNPPPGRFFLFAFFAKGPQSPPLPIWVKSSPAGSGRGKFLPTLERKSCLVQFLMKTPPSFFSPVASSPKGGLAHSLLTRKLFQRGGENRGKG